MRCGEHGDAATRVCSLRTLSDVVSSSHSCSRAGCDTKNSPQHFRASQTARQEELDAVLGERGCKEEKVLDLTKRLGKLACNFLFWSSFALKTEGNDLNVLSTHLLCKLR